MRMKIAGWVLGLVACFAVCPVLEAAAQEATETADGEAPPPKPEEKPSTMKAVIGYSLSIGGTFVVIALVVYTLSRTLKYEQARNAIIHLLRTAPNQAEMQCQTLPQSFATPIGAALKAGAMCAGTNDPAIIASATVPTYDAIGGVVSQHWKGLLGKAKLAGVAVVGAIAVQPSAIPIILAVVSAGGLLWMMYYKAEVDRSIFRAKVEVLPEVDRAFVDGRYYIPPRQ